MKKILIIAIALLTCFTASAYDYMIDGIAYNLNSDGKSLSVTFTTANMREANYPGLTSPIIPDSVTIDGNAMPVTAIGFHAFERTHFEAVTFPKTPVEIGEYAFYWSCLTSITLPEGLAKLGTGAFSSCYYLKSVHLPSSLSEFGTGAFLNCPGLASVTYSDGLSTIPSATFCLCTGLTSLEFKYPISVASSAFAECTGIKKVRVAADCEFDPNWITGVQIDTLELCDGISLVSGVAAHQARLTSIDIPNSVKTIGPNTFEGCTGLASFAIPSSVNALGDSFLSNTSLQSILSKRRLPIAFAEDATTFKGVDQENVTLYVPHGCKAAYESAAGWKDFGSIVEMELGDINWDGRVDVADLNMMVNHVLGTKPLVDLPDGDFDGNGKVDIADINAAINSILGVQ